MNYIKCLVLPLLLICLLCSCMKGENDLKLEISPENKSINELATQVYSDSQLTSIARFEGNIDELGQVYSIDCLRRTQNGYRASFLGYYSVAIVFFDNDGYKITSNVYKISLMSYDFESLNSTKTLDDVKKIDPNGEFLFLYTGRNDVPKISTHYTKDGYIILIEYEDNNQIVDITYELI
jgi:hypothetical protein